MARLLILMKKKDFDQSLTQGLLSWILNCLCKAALEGKLVEDNPLYKACMTRFIAIQIKVPHQFDSDVMACFYSLLSESHFFTWGQLKSNLWQNVILSLSVHLQVG